MALPLVAASVMDPLATAAIAAVTSVVTVFLNKWVSSRKESAETIKLTIDAETIARDATLSGMKDLMDRAEAWAHKSEESAERAEQELVRCIAARAAFKKEFDKYRAETDARMNHLSSRLEAWREYVILNFNHDLGVDPNGN